MSEFLPLLPELLEASLPRRAHFRRVGLLPHRPPATVLDLLEPVDEVNVGWAGSRDPDRLRRFLRAHWTCESLFEQAGLYPELTAPALTVESTARAA